ncbi:MAG: M13 family metallopeptidase [Clostridiaceae bacterium]|nr:M13 family metallopeptidase [Clostridiaceae bacterium]
MEKSKRMLAGMLAAGLMLGSVPGAGAVGATRGEVAQMVLQAADDYNPGVSLKDILQGDEKGDLREGEPATRAEALVMLQRAFGDLPAPVGDNARNAIPAGDFTDIPFWAKDALADVFEAGIVAGTSETTFDAGSLVTAEQMQRFIGRVYALEGSNPKDDFYAAVNKEALDSSVIPEGQMNSGTLYDMMNDDSRVSGIIEEAAKEKHQKGSPEQKIGDFYNNILDWDARNAAGITPVKPYLEAIDGAQTLDEVLAVADRMKRELYQAGLRTFGLTIDAKDSNRYIVTFSSIAPSLSKDIYEKDGGKEKDAFLKYLKALLVLGGYAEEDAGRQAKLYWEADRVLAAAKLEQQDYGNVEKIYNIFTFSELKEMFPKAGLDSAYAISGLAESSQILVSDVGLLKAAAPYFSEEHVDYLKTRLRIELLAGFGGTLNREFQDAAETYQQELLGTSGSITDEYRASQIVQQQFGTEIGRVYAEKYFSPEAKADVEEMVHEFLEIYEQRIRGLDWMSEATKEKAVEKLHSMSIKVGYPDDDDWDDSMDAVDIKSVAEGGSYFANMVEIARVTREYLIDMQGKPVDKSIWAMNVYTVNACYIAQFNEIVFPAGILRAPMYDVNNTREQNLGGIGYIIAHEITHAFDNNGAKFGKDGNAEDWWTAEDYAAFQKLCSRVVAHYDGAEGSNGVACKGELTLSENIADLGAAACVTEAAKRMENPDFKQLFETMARSWESTATRSTRQYVAQVDVHAPDKLRVNRVLVNLPEFYEAFDIGPGDGMYVAPEDRVLIW